MFNHQQYRAQAAFGCHSIRPCAPVAEDVSPLPLLIGKVRADLRRLLRSRAAPHALYSALSSHVNGWWQRRRSHPFADRAQAAAVQTLHRAELRSTVWAGGLSGEGVKRAAAFAAPPDGADGRRSFANRTGEAVAPRHFGDACQCARLHQSTPAVQQDEHSHDAQPDALRWIW